LRIDEKRDIVKEDLLFDLLKEKDEFSKIQYYIGISHKSKIGKSINNIIEQINKKINQITTELFSVNSIKVNPN
jgi:hypothetical protein